MEILSETIDRELPDLAEQGVRTRFLGRRDRVDGVARREDGPRWSGGRRTSTRSTSGSRSTTAAAPSSSRRRGGSSRTASAPDDVDEDALARAALRARASRHRPARSARRASSASRTSSSGRRRTRSSCSPTRCGPTSERTTCERRSTSSPRAERRFGAPVQLVSLLVSRIARRRWSSCRSSLGVVWLGGWWLFALALVGGLLALHELYAIARGLRPIVLGGYAGLVLRCSARSSAAPTWLLARDPRDARCPRCSSSSSRAPGRPRSRRSRRPSSASRGSAAASPA